MIALYSSPRRVRMTSSAVHRTRRSGAPSGILGAAGFDGMRTWPRGWRRDHARAPASSSRLPSYCAPQRVQVLQYPCHTQLGSSGRILSLPHPVRLLRATPPPSPQPMHPARLGGAPSAEPSSCTMSNWTRRSGSWNHAGVHGGRQQQQQQRLALILISADRQSSANSN